MWEAIQKNERNSAVLAGVMAALLLALGYFLGELVAEGGGRTGVVVAMALWLVLLFTSYFSGDQIFLALSGAKKIAPQDHPILYHVVEEMSIAAGLAKIPDITIVDESAPNAFATGRSPDHAAIAVTAGLLERLTRDELQGVIAHELSHIVNRDVLYMQMVGIMMGSIVLLADFGTRFLFYGGGRRRTSSSDRDNSSGVLLLVGIVLILLAPIFAQLLYFATSRKREYLADASGARLTRYPEGLASALEKIAHTAIPMKTATRATAPLYFANPLAITKTGLADLTSTHPPISQRIRILRSMGGSADLKAYQAAFQKVTGRPVGVIPFRAVAAETPVAVSSKAPDERTPLKRVREAHDALWRVNRYRLIDCDCKTRIKVPPTYSKAQIVCPHCCKRHPLSSPLGNPA